MNDDQTRTRVRLDLSEEMVRAVRARAGEDGRSATEVVSDALEIYLKDELQRIRAKLKQPEAGGGSKARKGKE